jgi:alkylation response protein AidB-like acyl-CoA dehydrogenase
MASKITAVRSLGEEPSARVGKGSAAKNGRRADRLTARQLAEPLARSAAALEEGLRQKDLANFYEVFRATELPLLAPAHSQDARGLYGACFEVLFRLGSISPAVGLAIENHYYVTSSLATFPTRGNPELKSRRDALVRSVARDHLLVANTNSRVHSDKVASIGAMARREGKGFRVSGTAAYMSLASQSDLVFFLTQVENEGPAIFVAPLRDNPEIEIGPLLFPSAMVDSDTRRVTFHEPFIPEENVLMVGRSEEMAQLGAFQLAWHQALLAGPYLGAAAGALEEARKFLRSVRAPNDKPLAELDGMIVDVGRMAIRHRSACCTARAAGEALESIARRRPKLPEFLDALDLACAAKQVGTKCAEEIVTEVRRMIGGRAFTGAHPVERLSQEVMFGPLSGEVNAAIDRRYGRRVLGEDVFLTHPW